MSNVHGDEINERPRFIEKARNAGLIASSKEPTRKLIEDLKDPRYLFLIYSWIAVGFNVLMVLPVLFKNYTEGYIIYNHYAVMIAFCGSFAAIAAVYKFIINAEKSETIITEE